MQINLKAALVEKKATGTPILNYGSIVNQKTLIWSIIWIGVFIRVFHFLDNRSLWRDEVYLATNIIELDLFKLAFSILEYEQKASVGFLWLSKLGVMLFGKGEMALRLFPLVSGILSLFVFLPVARHFLKPLGVVVAMVILSFAPPLVFHAVEAKQYSTELLASVVVLYLFIKYQNKFDIASLTVWGFAGVLVLFFSLSSIFVLAGIAISVSLFYLLEKKWKPLFLSLIPFTIWLAGFVLYYMVFLYKYADSEWLIHWFKVRGAFMPLVPSSVADVKWFVHTFYNIPRYPLGLMWIDLSHPNPVIHVLLRLPFLAMVFLVIGSWKFYKEDKRIFLVMILPILLTLLASGLEIYPFYERLIVFLAPIFILFIALGCTFTTEKLAKYGNWKYAFPAFLLAVPVISSAHQVINTDRFGDYKRSQQRSAFLYVNEKIQPGDIVYVNWNSEHAYRFYKNSYDLKFDVIEGKDPRFISANYQEYMDHLKPDLEELKGQKRVWLVYHKRVWEKMGDFDGQPVWYYQEKEEGGIGGGGEFLHKEFARMGTEVDLYETGEFSVSLFDLSEK